MRTSGYLNALALAACLAVAACGAQQSGTTPPPAAASVDAGEQTFQAHLDACTARHGYDPDAPGPVGPHELAPNERAFLSCAYDGVRQILMPQSRIPESYQRIIGEHQQLTDMVVAGEITRAERRTRTSAMIREVREQDLGMRSAPPASTTPPADMREWQLIDNVTRSVTGF